MLDNLSNGSNEKSILKRIANARSSTEPDEPTEELKAVEVDPEEIKAEEVEETTETIDGLVESVEDDSTDQDDQDEEELYIDLDGEEVSLSSVRDWKNGQMMQSDYTRKTMQLADDRKSVTTQREATEAKAKKLDAKIDTLETLINEFDNSEVDGMSLKELREIDPEQYLEVTEKQAKRKKAIEDAKTLRSSNKSVKKQESAQVELQNLVKNNPHWVKDGKETKAYTTELKQTETYLTSLGMSEEDQKGILLGGNGQVFIDAAKYHASKKTNAAIAKKVRKAPVTTRPSGAGKSSANTALEKARANHKKYGTARTAVELRKAQRNLKGN